ncbi:hypothetical protein BU25DRAFT_414277 [Macroventuria anomochaeta]|uniref:Uncharacterized protein n=1 Tax=Macroventuria anomochaeta TaxID=301207 RepID=A0ACB6RNY6_9PLEO|nr:uncharacterized protein BU25DRAFT_414277 [Macroventuria anomochaeta]KAF2623523.1 hypothetical protein BU25DRAFT_414277 [Macroventuria anomochaeta]
MVTFTNLPAEMRNIIYGKLLTDAVANPVRLNDTFSLLTTSRPVHEEAASYFYQHNTFTVSLPATTHNQERSSQDATILPPISDKYVKYLRHLTIDVRLNISRAPDCANHLAALANLDTALFTLTLNLSSNTSRVLTNRVDDCVLHAKHPITLALQHLLSSNLAQSVRINLNNVWFAPGLATQLQTEFKYSLELATSTTFPSLERAPINQTTQSYLYALGLEARDVEDAEEIQPPSSSADFFPSLPSSWSSALSALDQFSPTEHLYEDPGDLREFPKMGRADSLFDEPIFDMDDLEEGSEVELTEDDDVGDEEMEGIDDFDAILDNMEDVVQRRVNEMDVCYMTNFAPEMLGRWIEEAP